MPLNRGIGEAHPLAELLGFQAVQDSLRPRNKAARQLVEGKLSSRRGWIDEVLHVAGPPRPRVADAKMRLILAG